MDWRMQIEPRKDGRFYGHPTSIPAPKDLYGKPRKLDPPAVWFPTNGFDQPVTLWKLLMTVLDRSKARCW